MNTNTGVRASLQRWAVGSGSGSITAPCRLDNATRGRMSSSTSIHVCVVLPLRRNSACNDPKAGDMGGRSSPRPCTTGSLQSQALWSAGPVTVLTTIVARGVADREGTSLGHVSWDNS